MSLIWWHVWISIKGQNQCVQDYEHHNQSSKQIRHRNFVEQASDFESIVFVFSWVRRLLSCKYTIPDALILLFDEILCIFTSLQVVLTDYKVDKRLRQFSFLCKLLQLHFVRRVGVTSIKLFVFHKHYCNCEVEQEE